MKNLLLVASTWSEMGFRDKILNLSVVGFLSYTVTMPATYLLVQEEVMRDFILEICLLISVMSPEFLLVMILLQVISSPIVALFKK